MKIRKFKHVVLALMVTSFCGVVQADLKQGKYSYYKNDYKKALIELTKDDAVDSLEAELLISEIYLEGSQEVQKDISTAKVWFTKSFNRATELAESGDSDAEYYIATYNRRGFWYKLNGISVKKALEYYQKSADKGNSNAQNVMGELYDNGDLTALNGKRDRTLAVAWYQRSADQDNALGQFNLGWSYDRGIGVSKDTSKAVYWYSKAAEQGHWRAKQLLDQINSFYKIDSETVKNEYELKNFINEYETYDPENIIPKIKRQLGLIVYKNKFSMADSMDQLRFFISEYKDNDPLGLVQQAKGKLKLIEAKLEKERMEEERIRIMNSENERKKLAQLNAWRKNLKIGDDTFCGPIIELRHPMIKIAIKVPLAGYPTETWLKSSDLYPDWIAGCRNINGRLQPLF